MELISGRDCEPDCGRLVCAKERVCLRSTAVGLPTFIWNLYFQSSVPPPSLPSSLGDTVLSTQEVICTGVELASFLGSKLIQKMFGQLENYFAAVLRCILTKTTGYKGHLKE